MGLESVDMVQLAHTLRLLVIFAFMCGSAYAAPSDSSLTLSPSTCPIRTANYITHTLPQQCLPTARNSNSTSTEGGIVSSTATEYKTTTDVSKATSTVQSPIQDVPIVVSSVSAVVEVLESQNPRSAERAAAVKEIATKIEILEEDSALESGNFLSFEDWKKQNLKKAGQSEHIARRSQGDEHEPRKRTGNVDTLDTLGDDGEIDLDFSGFVPTGPAGSGSEATQPINDTPERSQENGAKARPKARSRDAGTTCKERFNYASFDCAANVLKTNKEAKGEKTVLLENKDSYMLNQCAAPNKFLILELCNDILIDTIVLANFEFFSSTFRTFRVSVSDRYPVKVDKWKTLGTYEARNSREVQAFLVENPLIWARYLRIEFLSHYGNEFYCPVSLVRIHGTTMMEDYKADLQQLVEDEADETEDATEDQEAVDSLTPEAVVEPLKPATTSTEGIHQATSWEGSPIPTSGDLIEQEGERMESTSTVADNVPTTTAVPPSVSALEAIASIIELSHTCEPAEKPTKSTTAQGIDLQLSSVSVDRSSPAGSVASLQTTPIANVSQSVSAVGGYAIQSSVLPDLKQNFTDISSSKIWIDENSTISATSTSSAVETSTSTGKNSTEVSTTTSPKPKSTPTSSSSDRSKLSSSTQAHQPVPTTQESFFKSVQKRLQMLESNSSLSLQYIEDQSRALRDAFKRVEQRQLARTSTFLEQLNVTVLNELREFRQQYDQLWQSTVIELQIQRERYERDNVAINARIGILADEVIFQRRMAIMQMILVLVCLVLVLFSRGAINNYLELPLVQNVLSRSPSSSWLNLSNDSSRRPSQLSRVHSAHELPTVRAGILKSHRRTQSEDSITDIQSGNEIYAPPTLVSDYGRPGSRDSAKTPTFESDRDDGTFGDPEFDPSLIERPATSPPTLRVNDGSPIVADVIETSRNETLSAGLRDKSNSVPDGDNIACVHEQAAPAGKHLSWKLPNS